MRVLHVYKTYFPDSYGGLEQTINQICLASNKYGVDNSIFTLSPKPYSIAKRPEANVHRYQLTVDIASCGFSLKGFYGFRKCSKSADVIHYHFPWPFADMLHLIHNSAKPSVVTYHSDIVRQKNLFRLYRPLMDHLFSSVHEIIATSQNYCETSDVLSRYREKVSVIPIGIDKASYPPASQECLNKWKSRVGENFFLFVGVLRYYKALHVLLDAIKGAKHRTVIAGSGPVEADLKRQASDLGLRNVDFLGFIGEEDKIALLTLCRAVVSSANQRTEAFGISLLEGAMFGKPMISSEIGTGTSFINIDNKTGFVVPSDDPLALRCAMDKLHNNDVIASEMSKAAHDRYLLHFTGEKMGKSYVEIYNKLLNRKENFAITPNVRHEPWKVRSNESK
ncbi:MAG: glycosyltransferase [Sulfuricaulis sp.]